VRVWKLKEEKTCEEYQRMVNDQGSEKPGFFLKKPNPVGLFGFYRVLLGFGFYWVFLDKQENR